MAAAWAQFPGRRWSREASGEARAPLRRVRGAWWLPEGGGTGSLEPAAAAGCRRRAGCGQPRGQRREVTEGKGGRRRAPPPTRQRSPGPARPAQPPPAAARPLKPVPERPASPKARGAGGTLALERASASLNAVAAACLCVAGAALRTRLSVRALGMPLAAPAPGLCGLRVPGLAVLAAWGRKGRGGALSGCGQEVARLKLESPEKAEEEEEMEGQLAGSCLALQAGESLPVRVRKAPSW